MGGEAHGAGQPDCGDAAHRVRGDGAGEHHRRAGQRAERQHPDHDRRAHCGDAVGAVAAVLQDLQSPLDRPATPERIGDVAEAVLVERSGDQQPDRDGDTSRDQRGSEVPHARSDAADRGTDQCAGGGKPGNSARQRRLGAQSDGHSSEELQRGEQTHQHSLADRFWVHPVAASATVRTQKPRRDALHPDAEQRAR